MIHSLLSLALATELQGCVGRSQAVNRAKEWTGTPYNGDAKKDGYTTGCMGLTGYAWQFQKPGIPSQSLVSSGTCTPISRGQLEMGDLMVNPSAPPKGHQLMFVSWANSTHYVAMQMSPSGCGQKTIKYPYWDGNEPQKFFPCKVGKACITEEQKAQQITE